ncbi:MAG TPA: hypothetical protein PLO33_15475, partial [Kouleothrix sp.]|nr:hypothetical protein [Kouleothrix sp.]
RTASTPPAVASPAADDNASKDNCPNGLHTHGVSKFEQEVQHRDALDPARARFLRGLATFEQQPVALLDLDELIAGLRAWE